MDVLYFSGFRRLVFLSCLTFLLIKSFGQSPQILPPLGHHSAIEKVIFKKEKKSILTISNDALKSWDSETGALLSDSKVIPELQGLSPLDINDQIFATRSLSGEIRIWNTSDFQCISSINLTVGYVDRLKIAPDYNHIGISTIDTLYIYDPKTEKQLTKIPYKEDIKDFLYTFTGDTIIVLTEKQFPKLYNSNSGDLLDSLSPAPFKNLLNNQGDSNFLEEDSSTEYLAFWKLSDDRKYLFLNTTKGFYGWNLNTSELIVKLPLPSSYFTIFEISPDNSFIAFYGQDYFFKKQCLRIWDIKGDSFVCKHFLEENESISRFKFLPEYGKMILGTQVKTQFRSEFDYLKGLGVKSYLQIFSFLQPKWDANYLPFFITDSTGKTSEYEDSSLSYFKYKDGVIQKENLVSSQIANFFISSDGKYVASSNFFGQCQIWEIEKFQESLNLNGHGQIITSHTLSSDSTHLILGFANGYIEKIDLKRGSIESWVAASENDITIIKYSSDGKTIFCASDRTISVFDCQNLLLKFSIECPGKVSRILTDNKSNNIVAIGVEGSFATIINLGTKVKKSFFFADAKYTKLENLKFSFDDKYLAGLATCSNGNVERKVMIWECQNLKDTILTIQINSNPDYEREEYVLDVIFTPDNKYFLVAISNGNITRWDLNNYKEIDTFYTFSNHSTWLNQAAFTADGSSLFLEFWTYNAGQMMILNYPDKRILYNEKGGSFFMTENQKYFCHEWTDSASSYQEFRSFNSVDRKFSFPFPKDMIEKSNLLFNDQFRIAFDEMMSFTIYSTISQKLFYKYIPIDSSDYLITTPEGRFDGTDNAIKLLSLICGDEIIQLESVRKNAWEPNLAEKTFSESPKYIKEKLLKNKDYCEYGPIVKSRGMVDSTWKFTILQRNGGIGDIVLYVGLKQIKIFSESEKQIFGQEIAVIVQIDSIRKWLSFGEENELSIRAYAKDNKFKSRNCYVTFKYGNKSKSNSTNVYVISIGISKFKNDSLRLKYTSKDAQEVSSLITQTARNLFNFENSSEHVFVKLINSDGLNESSPTKSNINEAFNFIRNNADPNDIVFCFLSSHGVIGNDNMFYFLTSEATSYEIDNDNSNKGISGDSLISWLKSIRAQKQIMILDACHSGKFLDTRALSKGEFDPETNTKIVLENIKSITGTYILAASQSSELAYEPSNYGRGILPFCLLMGIKDGEALIENTFLDVNRWFDYTARNVVPIARKFGLKQHPQVSLNTALQIGKVDRFTRESINLIHPQRIFSKSAFWNEEYSNLKKDTKKIGFLVDSLLNEETYRDKDCPFDFYPEHETDSSFSISGSYRVKKDLLKVKVTLAKGIKSVYQFSLNLDIEDKARIKGVEEILRRVINKL